jgi:hypothetical protein
MCSFEDFQFARPHPVEHHHQAGLDGYAVVFELGVLVEHVEALVAILLGEGYASALQGLALTVTRPSPG